MALDGPGRRPRCSESQSLGGNGQPIVSFVIPVRPEDRSMLLEGKTVVVAGIGPGLGRAIALRAAEEGAALALVSRSPGYAGQMVSELEALGQRAIAVQGDLSSPDDCARIAGVVASELGGIDVV